MWSAISRAPERRCRTASTSDHVKVAVASVPPLPAAASATTTAPIAIPTSSAIATRNLCECGRLPLGMDAAASEPDRGRKRGTGRVLVAGADDRALACHTVGHVRSSIRSISGRCSPTLLSRSTTSSPCISLRSISVSAIRSIALTVVGDQRVGGDVGLAEDLRRRRALVAVAEDAPERVGLIGPPPGPVHDRRADPLEALDHLLQSAFSSPRREAAVDPDLLRRPCRTSRPSRHGAGGALNVAADADEFSP